MNECPFVLKKEEIHQSFQRAFRHKFDTFTNSEAFQRLGGCILIALDGTEYFCSQKLDGTEYFCSQKLGCPQCLTRKRSNGKTESYHATLAATVVALVTPW